jgi:hypothetical protein
MNFPKLISNYLAKTSSFRKIQILMPHAHIDHMAQRSLNLNSLIKPLILNNYCVQKDIYNFKNINVTAKWFKHKNCGDFTSNMLTGNKQCIPYAFVSQYNGPNNVVINSKKDYEDIYNQNQYLAWTLIHREAINHLAIRVDNIEYWFEYFSKSKEFNVATGLQVSYDKNLLQFSLEADRILHEFKNGSVEYIPGFFVEFIERKNNREGFEHGNAINIFESTR